MYASLPEDIRDTHPFHMYDEIRTQPAAVGRSLALAETHAGDAIAAIAAADRVVLTGCGTSLHAAQAGAWMLTMLSRGSIDARAVDAFDLVQYPSALREGTLVIAVTHSGTTVMTLRALEAARAAHARSVIVTGFPERVTAEAVALPTGFPEERSWAHTASYTSAIATLAAVANGVASPSERLDLSPLPEVVKEALELEEMAQRLAAGAVVVERYADTPPIAIVGGGPNGVTAREAVLKLLETSYVQAQAYDLEFMLHGPLASMTPDTLLVIIAPTGASASRAADLAKAAHQIGLTPMVLADSETADLFEDAHRLVLPDVPEVLSPMTAVVPLQFFSYYLSIGKRLNPDLLHRDDERYRAARAQYE